MSACGGNWRAKCLRFLRLSDGVLDVIHEDAPIGVVSDLLDVAGPMMVDVVVDVRSMMR